MKKRIFGCLLMMFSFGFGQIQQPRNDSFNELVFFIGSNNSDYDSAEGSRYLNEEFTLARINDLNQLKLVRFNVVENKIEIKDDDKIMSLSQSFDYILKLSNEANSIYETKPYIDEDGNSGQSFFEIICKTEEFELYLKERIKFFPKKPSKSSYEQGVPAKFIRVRDKFYVTGLKKDAKELTEIPKRKKDFIKLLEDPIRAKDLDSFIKREKLSLEIKNNIIKILDFYILKNKPVKD